MHRRPLLLESTCKNATANGDYSVLIDCEPPSMETVRGKRRRKQIHSDIIDLCDSPNGECFPVDAKESVVSKLHLTSHRTNTVEKMTVSYKASDEDNKKPSNPSQSSHSMGNINNFLRKKNNKAQQEFSAEIRVSKRNAQAGSKATTTTLNRGRTSTSKVSLSRITPMTQQGHGSLTAYLLEEDVERKWERSQHILQTKFHIPSLRSLQPTVVRHVLSKKSCIIVMATGGGKSLCYQLPAATFHGLTVVVSPLIALMIDQVQSLQQKGIPAELVCSSNTEKENKRIMNALLPASTSGTSEAEVAQLAMKLLYCTPELIVTDRFRNLLLNLYKNRRLSLIAIDEAHTLSSWGHEFRPAYRKLSWVRQSFPDIPCIACTATATPKVIEDLRSCLMMTNQEESPCFKASFNRPNISYSVRFKDTLFNNGGPIKDLLSVVQEQHTKAYQSQTPCSGIVYVHKRSDTTLLADHINSSKIELIGGGRLKAAPYHAGLKDTVRKQTQKDWTDGEVQIAVATVAFGMGIDLPHVRYVIHWTMAKSVEGFYQESGRAGRDGKPSASILYYSKDDVAKFTYLIQITNKESQDAAEKEERRQREYGRSLAALKGMENYCMTAGCRRKYLLEYFGEKVDVGLCNNTCDYCQNPSKVEEAMRASQVVKEVIASARAYNHSALHSKRISTKKDKQEWDGQWDQPHGDAASDDENNFEGQEDDFWDDNIESFPSSDEITKAGQGTQKSKSCGKLTGFVKASSILSKYEVLECQSGQPNGFVHLKLNRELSEPPSIPDHLQGKNLPEPLLWQQKNSKSTSSAPQAADIVEVIKRSEDVTTELQSVQERLAKLKEKRAARLATQGNKQL